MKYSVDDAVVDFERKRLVRGETEVELEPRVAEVLCYLVENAGRVVGREEVLNAVWRTVNVSDDVLTRCVNLIRKAFDDDPASPRVLETITKRGYRLIANVQPLDQTASAKTVLINPRFEAGVFGGRITLTRLDMADAQRRVVGAAHAAIGISREAVTVGNSVRAAERGRAVIARAVDNDLVVEVSRRDFAMAASLLGGVIGFLLAAVSVIGTGMNSSHARGIALTAALVGAGIGWGIRRAAARSLERRLREDLSVLLNAARIH